jgi:outer membrane lipoprotein SlyB
MMSIGRWTPVTAVMVGTLALAGCGDQKSSLTAQGAGVGAVGGAVLGGLLGGQRGALIGAAIGGIGGAGTGYYLGSQQEQFASAEEELRVRTERARTIAATQRGEANNARTAAATYERSLAPLSQQVAAGRQLNSQQQATLQKARADRDEIRSKLEAGQKASDEVRTTVANLKAKGQNTAALEAEGRDLAASNTRLQGALDRMNSALGKIEA